MNRYKATEQNINGTTIEKLENYDKGEQIMIYLNKDHDIENKYDRVDWVLTPLVVFFNNTLDLLGKKNIEHVRNLMNELPCSMQRAMDILKLTTYERKKLKNIFIHKRTCKLHVLFFINQYFSIKLRIFSHFTINFFYPIFFQKCFFIAK